MLVGGGCRPSGALSGGRGCLVVPLGRRGGVGTERNVELGEEHYENGKKKTYQGPEPRALPSVSFLLVSLS